MNNLSAHMVHPYVYIIFLGIFLCCTTQTYALETNKNLTLNDNAGDSPQIILVDEDNKKLVLEKLDSGTANLFNDEGSICLLSTNDSDDIICFATKADRPGIFWSLAGVSEEAEPGIQISLEGKLQYRNKAGSWSDFDSLKSTFEIVDGAISSSKLDAAVGTPGQVLSLTNDGALKWVTPDAVVIDDNAITSSKIADESVSAVDLATNAVTSLKITDATIIDADINASAAIAGTKIAPDFGEQAVTTTGDIEGKNIISKGDVKVGNAKGLKLADADGSNYMALQAPNNVQVDTTLTLPTSAGSDGQVLQTDGTGTLSWASAAVDTSLATANQTLTADRTIELGSNTLTVTGTNLKLPDESINTAELAADAVTTAKLEDGAVTLTKLATGAVNSNAIVDASIAEIDIAANAITTTKIDNGTIANIDINDSAAIDGTKIKPDFGAQLVNTTGDISGANITATGDVTVGNKKAIKLLDAEGGQYIELKAPQTVGDTVTFTLPAEYGETNQVLQTDGSGNLTWASAAVDTNTSLANANQTLTADRTIELGSNTLTVTGTNLKLPDESISTAELAADAVTSAKLEDGAVTLTKLATGAVNSNAIVNASIAEIDIAANAITTTKILDAAVTTAKLAGSVVETANLADDAVTSAKLADDTIVNVDINSSAAIAGTKIAPDFGAQLINTTGDISGANITATGDVTVGKEKSLKLSDKVGSNYVILKAPDTVEINTTLTLPTSAGSDGQVLQTDGTGTLSWASAAADTSLANANQTLTADRTIELGDKTLSVTSNGDGDKLILPDESISTVELAADAVTSAKLEDGAVTLTKLATGAVNSNAIVDASIEAIDIAANAITTAKILDATVTTAKLAGSAVETANLANEAVTSAKIENGTIANIDINDSAAIDGTKIKPDFGAQLVNTTGDISGANITATGDVTVGNKKAIKLLDAEGGQYIELKAPQTVADTVTFTLPAEYGEANQVLQTDGSGNLTWASAAEDTNTSLANADQTLTASRTIRLGSNSLTVEGTGANVTLPNESIDTDELAADAITSVKLEDGAVTLGKLAASSVNSNAIVDASIAEIDIATNAITTTKILDDAVTSAKLAGSSVETVKLAAGAVTSTKIADDTIVNADINTSAAIAGTKIAPDFGTQLINTTGDISGTNITATGDVTVGNKKAIKLLDAEGGQYIELKAPQTIADTVTLTLPAEDGEANQVLQTDGTGMLSWASVGAAKTEKNIAIGKDALDDFDLEEREGNNTAIGNNSQERSSSANSNVSLGNKTLKETITGSGNTAIGFSALQNSIGSRNTAIGKDALSSLNGPLQDNNIAIGVHSGKEEKMANNSIFIGNETISHEGSNINEIVIGHAAKGKGNNSIVLGNDDIKKTYLKGDLILSKYINDNNEKTITLKVPEDLNESYDMTLPAKIGNSGEFLKLGRNGLLNWTADTSLSSADQTLTTNRTIDLKNNTLTVTSTGDGDNKVTLPNESIGTTELAYDAVTSAKLADDTIDNVDIKASAAIEGTKIKPDFGTQAINTTGDVSGANITATGDVTVGNKRGLKLSNNGSKYVILKAPVSLLEDSTLILPAEVGSKGQVLETNGAGELRWKYVNYIGSELRNCNGKTDVWVPYDGEAHGREHMEKNLDKRGFCVDKKLREKATWSDANNICKSEGKRLIEYDQLLRACTSNSVVGFVDLSWGSIENYTLKLSSFVLDDVGEWASNAYPVHYIDLVPGNMHLMEQKIISGAGALVAYNTNTKYAKNSCHAVRTVMIQWTEILGGEKGFKTFKPLNKDAEPKFKYRCAY